MLSERMCLVICKQLISHFPVPWNSLVAQVVKNLPAMQETLVQSLVGKIPWRRKWQPTPVFSLEHSMDRGAWRTTVHGIAKSWTQLRDWFSLSLSKHWLVISLCLRKTNYGVLIFGEWVKLRKSLLFIWKCHGGKTDIVRYLKGGIHKSIERIKWTKWTI